MPDDHSAEAAGPADRVRLPREALTDVRVRAPSRGNRRLERLLEAVKISPGRDRAVRVEIAMSNSAGIFQVDELLATKRRGSGLEQQIEVIARIEAEHELRLIPVFRI